MSTLTPNKSLTLPSGTHYGYIYLETPASSRKPTLLFLHGFPSTSYDWRHQIPFFHSLGYGVLAPDLLGYGSSSKPTSPSAYLGSIMAADIIAILDHENIKNRVIGISHDWGTWLLSQLASYYPERFDKYVFMSVPFTPPGREFKISEINALTKKLLGYEQYGYWLFLTADGAGKTIGDHWESFFHIAFAADPAIWKTAFAPIDGMKSSIMVDFKPETASFVTEADKAHHHAVFGDDYSSCVNWYKRGIVNLGVEEERLLLQSGKMSNKLKQDTLMVTGLKDAVCIASHVKQAAPKNVEDGKLKIVDIDAGHWIMLEKVDETNRVLREFIEGVAEAQTMKSVL